MAQRRMDEETGMTIEYAWFLADTRGIGFALQYLDSCSVPRAYLMRAVGHPELRRTHERWRAPRVAAPGAPVGEDGDQGRREHRAA